MHLWRQRSFCCESSVISERELTYDESGVSLRRGVEKKTGYVGYGRDSKYPNDCTSTCAESNTSPTLVDFVNSFSVSLNSLRRKPILLMFFNNGLFYSKESQG